MPYLRTVHITKANILSFDQLSKYWCSHSETQAVEDHWSLAQEEQRQTSTHYKTFASKSSCSQYEPVESFVSIEDLGCAVGKHISRQAKT